MTVCILCSMRAWVRGEQPPRIPEDPREHFEREHPDPAAFLRERRELEQQLRLMRK